jgi:hypothetical protein
MNTTAVLAFLRDQQKADGNFVGKASASLEPFAANRVQPTIFPTMLILDCLHDVVGAEDIRLRAAKYLEQQVGDQGSWNYWEANSPVRAQQPYPDDLDDTACALAALMRADASWVSGYRLGQFARLLVAAEQQPGGPYNTWLIDTSGAAAWRHIDIAVNANIGYALSLQSVQVSGLTRYIEESLLRNKLQSSYYVGEAPVLYFISRWYRGEYLSVLRARITDRTTDTSPKTALQQALLLTAGCHVGLPVEMLSKLANGLQKSISRTAWPAAPLYVDPVYDKRQHYGGSRPLTTAFALEALTAYSNQVLEPPIVIARKRGVPQLMTAVREDAETITGSRLRHRYLATARRIMQDVAGEQITAPATLTAQAGGWSVPSEVLNHLNLGSLNGWMAYTVYDDILDGDSQPAEIGVANIALRRSFCHLTAALPEHSDFKDYIASVFDTIDSANDWEQQYGHVTVNDGNLEVTQLPDYKDLSQLASRSLGHSLAACGVMAYEFGSLKHPQVQAMKRFFRHFLIARQLNDDAHDWEADLHAGRLSAVVSLLLADTYRLPHSLVISEELDRLRQQFWQQTITQVSELIAEHITQARHALQLLDVKSSVFMGWLDALEVSVATALQGRDEALQFMQAYEAKHV